jgi:GNAT superfamily N-acetyltransferase
MPTLIGFAGNVPWRHYLGLFHGEPAATATLFLTPGVAGIYFVMTAPAFRRRGLGAAITRAALDEALTLDAQLAVLGASEPGFQLYRQMGFAEYCRIGIYEWHSSRF